MAMQGVWMMGMASPAHLVELLPIDAARVVDIPLLEERRDARVLLGEASLDGCHCGRGLPVHELLRVEDFVSREFARRVARRAAALAEVAPCLRALERAHRLELRKVEGRLGLVFGLLEGTRAAGGGE